MGVTSESAALSALRDRTAVHPGGGNDLITRVLPDSSSEADEVRPRPFRGHPGFRIEQSHHANRDPVSPQGGSASTLTGSDELITDSYAEVRG